MPGGRSEVEVCSETSCSQAICSVKVVGGEGPWNTLQVCYVTYLALWNVLVVDGYCRVAVDVGEESDTVEKAGPNTAVYPIQAGLPQFSAYLRGLTL